MTTPDAEPSRYFRDPIADVELDADFGTADTTELITSLLVIGQTRDGVARRLGIELAEVDQHVAHATAQAEAEALDEREWLAREQLRDLVRQTSSRDLSSHDVTRLSLLVDLAKLELGLIDAARRRAGVA